MLLRLAHTLRQSVDLFVERYFNPLAGVIVFAVVITLVLSDKWQWLHEQLLDRGLYLGFLTILCVEILRRTYEMRATAPPKKLRIVTNQVEALDVLRELMRDRPTVQEAHILAYAGSRMEDLLHDLAATGIPIKFLVCDSRKALNRDHSNRIRSEEKERQRFFRHYSKYSVATYTAPAALRGIHLVGCAIAVGWYTYERMAPGLELHGPSNPMLICDTSTTEGHRLAQFFEASFAALGATAMPIVGA